MNQQQQKHGFMMQTQANQTWQVHRHPVTVLIHHTQASKRDTRAHVNY